MVRWVAALLMLGTPASAFTFATPVSDGCHESLTLSAVLAAGWPGGRTPPEPDRATRALRDNLLFDAPSEANDLWTISALIGVRHVDLGGARPSEIDQLAGVHNDAEGQASHCLRAPGDDGHEGEAAALAACRAFILGEVVMALGEGEMVDPGETMSVRVATKYESRAVVSRFAFHMGRSLHALQDSFTHTFRHPDAPRVVLAVFSYVDPAFSSDYEPARDGHPHVSAFDTCPRGENLFRVGAATEASVALWAAVVAPGARDERLARVDAVLDDWLTLSTEPCVPDNRYCGVLDADGTPIEPLEVGANEEGCDCASAPPPAWALCALVLLAARRRRR